MSAGVALGEGVTPPGERGGRFWGDAAVVTLRAVTLLSARARVLALTERYP